MQQVPVVMRGFCASVHPFVRGGTFHTRGAKFGHGDVPPSLLWYITTPPLSRGCVSAVLPL